MTFLVSILQYFQLGNWYQFGILYNYRNLSHQLFCSLHIIFNFNNNINIMYVRIFCVLKIDVGHQTYCT